MLARSSLVIAALLCLCLPSSSLSGQEAPALDALLPPGEFEVEILEMAPHPASVPLAEKLQAAMQANPDWFNEYVAQAEPEQPLAYHPNLGMTAEEYERMLTLMDSAAMVVTGTAGLTIARSGEAIVLSSGDLPALDGMAFSSSGSTVETSLSTIDDVEEVSIDGPYALVGPWDGWTYTRSEGDPVPGGDAVEESLSVGRLRAEGQTLISYSFRQMESGELTGRFDQVIRFRAR